ncbi:MAG: histidine kinase N-terminal 7TM domain-containing protein [Oscillospiraceae bacterium]
MGKGARNCICRVAAWVTLCLVFFSLGGCARDNAQSTVVCNGGENEPYSEVVSKILPSHAVVIQQGSRTAFSFLGAGNEVEAFDAQAIPALENGIATHWYPHYLATVVLAVDRDRTDERIGSWSDLSAVDDIIGYSDVYPDRYLLMGAIAYGLEGDGFTLKKAAGLLETLHTEKRLARKTLDAPILICYDYQAAALIKSGRNMQIIVPSEGTLAYHKGLLSGAELHFTSDVEPLLLSAGFRLLDGRCDSALYPPAAEYENAATVADDVHLNTVFQDVNHIFRRNVLHTRLYSSANGREHQFFVLLYMVLVVIWTASVFRRAMQRNVQRATQAMGFVLLGWITVRLIKYQLEEAVALNRYLWYGFYLFQMALPLVLLWLAWAVDQPDDQAEPPKWLRVMAAINGALISLVFTNDLHNWVFTLDLSNPNWSFEYGYGIGFFFVTAAWVVQLVTAVVILIIKSRRTPRKRGLVLLLAFCALLILYGMGYITRIPIAWDSDYTMVVGLFTLLFMEVCMRTGMVPVNTKYERLFTHSPLNMQIIDSAETDLLSSASAMQVDHTLLRRALQSYPLPVEQDENTLLFTTGITGGYALWQEDISKLNLLQTEMEESVRKLTLTNAVLAEEKKIRQALDEETANNQLMTQLENEIAAHVVRLSAMIEQLDTASDQPKETGRIALLLCYVKRRCNLFFRERETTALPGNELTAYVDELAEMAAYSDVKILVTSGIKSPIPVRQATLFYDFFYTVIDWASSRECPTMLAHLETGKETMVMRLLPSCDPRSVALSAKLHAVIRSSGGVFSMKDLDGAVGLQLAFPKGGEGSD